MDVDRITLGLALIVLTIAITPFTSAQYGFLFGGALVAVLLGGGGILLVRRGLGSHSSG